MLPVDRRIKKQTLPFIFKQNRAYSSEFFILRVNFPAVVKINANQSRFAVIVANKTIPRAVDRHLVKRRIHQLIQEFKNLKKENLNLIIQIKKSPLNLTMEELKTELELIFNQARIFNP